MMPLVSIIVPIHNVEKYVKQCIRSVLDQSNGNYELILINDGSSDNCGILCDEYAEKDTRIVVKHINNSGVSNARNIGIKIARGRWLLFLDGDDFLDIDAVDSIARNVKKQKDVDMILGSFNYINYSSIVPAENKTSITKGFEVLHDYGLWNIKIRIGSYAVRKEIVDKHNILFDTTTKYGEDVEYINYCLINAAYVMVTKEYFVNYRVHEESAIAKVNFDRYDCYKSRYRTLKYIQQKFPGWEEMDILYKYYLLPEAIIDTTNLLCRKGVNIVKIVKFLNETNYYNVIQTAKNNEHTPEDIRKRINKFLDRPLLTWVECFLSTHYYNVRSNFGLLKRRIFS